MTVLAARGVAALVLWACCGVRDVEGQTPVASWNQVATGPPNPKPSGRTGHILVCDEAGDQLLLFSGLSDGSSHINDMWSYNIAGDAWSQLSPTGSGGLPDPRGYATGVFDQANRILYMHGGWSSTASFAGDMWAYDAATNEWIIQSTSGPTFQSAAAALDEPNQVIFVYGGWTGGEYSSQLWLYDIAAINWISLTPNSGTNPPGLYRHSLAIEPVVGKLYLFAGNTGSGLTDALWEYTTSTLTWALLGVGLPGPPVARQFHSSVVDLSSNIVLFYGGRDNSFNTKGDLWSWDISGGSWSEILPSSSAAGVRAAHAMAWHSQSLIGYVHGGSSLGSDLSDMWSFSLSPAPGTGTTTTSTTTTTTGGPAVVEGDPVVHKDGVKLEFNLPLGVFTPMLLMPDLHILAEPLPGGEDGEQWIGQVVVKTADDQQVIRVRIKEDIADFNRSANLPNAFRTVDVYVGRSIKPLRAMPAQDIYWPPDDGVRMAFGRFPSEWWSPLRHYEVVAVTGAFAKVVIVSRSAAEKYGMTREAVDYAHLDVMFEELRDVRGAYGGLLAELWGSTPLSDATKAMVK